MDSGVEKRFADNIVPEQNYVTEIDTATGQNSYKLVDATITYQGTNSKINSNHSERQPSKPATLSPKFYGGSHAKF